MREGTIEQVLRGEAEWVVVTGDATALLPPLEIPSAIIVTDPPFGIDHKSNGQIFKNAHRCSGDADLELMEWVADFAGIREYPIVCFFSPHQPPRVKWRSVLVWAKGAHVGGGGDIATCWKRDAELIGIKGNAPLNGQRDSSVLSFNALSPPPSGHFCEKPKPLMSYLVGKVSQPGDVILDPFAGSGTTGVAAVSLGRRFIGIEQDAGWAEVSRRRIREAEPVLFTRSREEQAEMFQ